ncbi:MAG: ASKHA domain-containing protein [Lachnospiraceae bacterium]|nr:ASKHA domain-containing protein [Lachnospiraceae bacterium]
MNRKIGIAIDIGTTTVAAATVTEKGEILREAACANSGSAFGADVMSRIKAASEGGAQRIRACMCRDITGLITALIADQPIPGESADLFRELPIVLAGNTTMLHLLNGYDCTGLGQYPYTPVSLAREERRASELFPGIPSSIGDARVIELPGISAFVGADIVAGLFATDALRIPETQTTLFLDLGTNGEMALIRSDPDASGAKRISVCATAAGPVFEGAGIREGMRGEKGAIEEVVLIPASPGDTGDHSVTSRCRTIDNASAAGICGSGVLEAVSELARLHLIDQNGLLAEPWFSDGFPLARRTDDTEIRLYQEDIRAVQLAKAAIRAGMETLPLACGIPAKQIDTVLVAGAFGKALPFSRLSPLGLFTPTLLSRCRAVGNTSLAGAAGVAKALLAGPDREKAAYDLLDRIISCTQEIPLAGRQDFEACYLGMMGF